MNYSKDFSKKTIASLAKKGVVIIGATAVPMFEGDTTFAGTAYVLNAAGCQIIRTYNQVVVMGSSSWIPETV